jgi:hypothetical protein
MSAFTIVSHATLLEGSWASIASKIASDMWSATLSGWPIVTDSLVKRYLSVSQFVLHIIFLFVIFAPVFIFVEFIGRRVH